MKKSEVRIASFYEFKHLEGLPGIKSQLLDSMERNDVRGTVILASEGFNSTVSGSSEGLARFVEEAFAVLGARPEVKFSSHDRIPFKRRKVKIKREIVTLKHTVDVADGEGTHVEAKNWNRLIEDPETFLLDTRNSYEVSVGKFRGAVDPSTSSFSELPGFVAENLDPGKHKRIAMYCTGGIRCEKFAPYLKQIGFREVYQLRGGILKYLEETPVEESLWEGECFVFDERVSVDDDLKKGKSDDPSFFKNRHGGEKDSR